MLEIVTVSLLEPECQYIAHQCNCYSTRSAGLATAVFKAFPWADVYSDRRQRGNDAALFGSITIHGNPQLNQRHVINIYGQLYPGSLHRGGILRLPVSPHSEMRWRELCRFLN